MKDCIFCKIVKKEIPARVCRETELVLAFDDVAKLAPVHILIIPKEHIQSINDLTDEQGKIIAEMFLVARDLAKELKIAEGGYKLLIRTGRNGGQEVPHIHLHLIGGARLTENIHPATLKNED
jgi:histidine triad (HIT) family protein